jgi:hypothetical protein
MNNATRENAVHPLHTSNDGDQDDSRQFASEEPFNQAEQKDLSAILDRLDQIRYTPRAATLRAIMKYAHGKNETIH